MTRGIDELHLLDVIILNLYIEVEKQTEMGIAIQEDHRRISSCVQMPYMLSAERIL